jgi:hypothetical protein
MMGGLIKTFFAEKEGLTAHAKSATIRMEEI